MVSKILPTDTRRVSWSFPDGVTYGFAPHGRKQWHGRLPEVDVSTSEPLYSARLVVGFHPDGEPAYEMADLISSVCAARKAQTGDPSSSAVFQHGVCRHRRERPIEEPGAQVIIVNPGATVADFVDQMTALAETIACRMHRAMVVVEIQRNGVRERGLAVGADQHLPR